MRPKSLILLLLALGCGLVAAVGINQVLANRPVEQAQEAGELVPIFIALTDIGLGDPLTPEVLKLEEWPKTKVPAGAMTKLEEVEGRRARTKFYAGEPIIEAKLLSQGDQGSGATDLIPRGYRVVAVKVDDVSGSGLILPGDRVDALVHLTDHGGGESNRSSTRTFLHNVKVFAVNNVYSRESNGSEAITAKTISLLVTPQQAELVTLANEMGKIRLVMRSADDETQEETDGVTQSELFKGSETPTVAKSNTQSIDSLFKSAEKPAAAAVEKPAPAAPEMPVNLWKMRLIEGNTIREVEFENGNVIGGPVQIRTVLGPADQNGNGMNAAPLAPQAPITSGPTATPPEEESTFVPAPDDNPPKAP